MDIHLFLPFLVYSIFTLFFLFFLLPTSYSEDDKYYSECSKPFDCGKLTDLSYPFWADGRPEYCGYQGFKLRCRRGQFPLLNISNQDFRVLFVNTSQNMMRIVRADLFDNKICPKKITEIPQITASNDTLFHYEPEVENITIAYDCSPLPMPHPYSFPCAANGEEKPAIYVTDEFLREQGLDPSRNCKIKVQIPFPADAIHRIMLMNGVESFQKVFRDGISAVYMFDQKCEGCVESKGICCTNSTTSLFSCLCSDRPYRTKCGDDTDGGTGTGLGDKWLIAIGASIFTVIGILVTCGLICLKKTPTIFVGKFWKSNQDFEAFLQNNGPLSVKRYNFSEVKKMTKFFKDKLGQGGYGSVYKGKLCDGRFVAVKVLNACRGGEGAEFINEVASISRTSHVNVVTLLGFCLEGKKRALVYEFMPNGSLDKFICSSNMLKLDCQLGWVNMHEIAIGIARGLEYLHCRCNTRIVHFDIKPHNILLDEHFHPKISDFGLAKLYTKEESILSMLEARGTIGYIAPEVFSRNFGRVSSKSDVYSYGMMVLDIVGGRERNEVGSNDTSSDKYFPNWIYKQLELSNESEFHGEISVKEGEIVRKMTVVGLWCIQTNPSDRPAMGKVIEMLEGSLETLKIPPMPFASSHPKSPTHCSFTISTT